MGVGWVEALLVDVLKLQTAHHGVEEDLQEVHVVPVGLLHHLDPLNCDSVVGAVMLRVVDGQLCHLLE